MRNEYQEEVFKYETFMNDFKKSLKRSIIHEENSPIGLSDEIIFRYKKAKCKKDFIKQVMSDYAEIKEIMKDNGYGDFSMTVFGDRLVDGFLNHYNEDNKNGK